MNHLKQLLEKQVGILFPGATFSYVTEEKTYIDYVGDTNIDMLYDLASLTKVIVTNTLVSIACLEKKLNYEDRFTDYLFEYQHLNTIDSIYYPITIKDLLTHQSALKIDNIKDELLDINKYSYNQAKKKCYDNIKNIKIDMNLVIKKGNSITKKVNYANINFIILKELIERIYNKPFDELASKKIFEKLKMNNTHFNRIEKHIDKTKYAPTENTLSRGLICGEVHDENAYFLGGVSGNAGLFSNIKDVSKFVQMILNDGLIEDNIFLRKKTIRKWFIPYNSERALSWEYYDNNIIRHTGFTGTFIFINKNKNIAIIVLSNRLFYGRDNKRIYDLFEKISKLYK